MGGIPPLDYLPDGRSLAIVDEQAAIVKTFFQRYLAIDNVRRLWQARCSGASLVGRTAQGRGQNNAAV